jgi:hypothetical protein
MPKYKITMRNAPGSHDIVIVYAVRDEAKTAYNDGKAYAISVFGDPLNAVEVEEVNDNTPAA